MRRTPAVAFGLAAALLAPPAAACAIDVADGKLSLHGDGEWAYRQSTHGNTLLGATPDGNYDTALFDLVLNVRPAPGFVIGAQLGFDPDGTAAEWVFAELRLTDDLRLRVGKVQQPFGNFNELRFAGTTRAFFDLPVSIYGPASVLGTAYLGAGHTGDWVTTDGWGISADLYGGAVDLTELEGFHGLTGSTSTEPVAPEVQQAREIVGGRITLISPSDLVLRLSAFAGRIGHDSDDGAEAIFSWGPSIQYRGDRLWLSAEAFHTREVGAEQSIAGYLAASWFLTQHLQVSLRQELSRTFAEHGPHSSRLLHHNETAVGLGWWVNPGLVFKGSFHWVHGNRFALPEGATPTSVLSSPPTQMTLAWVLGTQFTF